jgi:hypothetical protein
MARIGVMFLYIVLRIVSVLALPAATGYFFYNVGYRDGRDDAVTEFVKSFLKEDKD